MSASTRHPLLAVDQGTLQDSSAEGRKEKPDRNNYTQVLALLEPLWSLAHRGVAMGCYSAETPEAVTAQKSLTDCNIGILAPSRLTQRYRTVCMYCTPSLIQYIRLHARHLTLSCPRRIALPRAALPAEGESRKAVPAAGRAACGVGAREGSGQMMRRLCRSRGWECCVLSGPD